MIIETIPVDFDELTAMTSEQFNSRPMLKLLTPRTISSGLMPNIPSSTPPISTRQQLQDEVLFCYFDAFLSSVKTKSYKDALMESCWIEAMQEELNEFERLEVWELVPRPERIMVITLKWIYSVKLDELRSVLKNNTRLVARSYRWKEELIKKYGMETYEPTDTPMAEKSKLDENLQGKAVDPTCYHGMIGTLMYLTASRPDLLFALYMCAQYQAKPTKKHLHAVKRILRYLRGTINMGMWYPKDSCVSLTAFVDADHAGCQDTKKSTSGSMQLLDDRLVSCSSKKQKSTAISSNIQSKSR
nr:uncharacterized mitochondrial protein AtMg00810-like [Tanacetum cinerariifolium]